MDNSKLLELVIQTLEDHKAEDVVSLNVKELTNITDWMVICNATSKRHANALADHIISKTKERGIRPLGVEGEGEKEWLLVDLGDIVIHIMLFEIRKFYNLEKLWNVTEKAREGSD